MNHKISAEKYQEMLSLLEKMSEIFSLFQKRTSITSEAYKQLLEVKVEASLYFVNNDYEKFMEFCDKFLNHPKIKTFITFS